MTSKQSSPHNWSRPDFIPEPVAEEEQPPVTDEAPVQNDEFAPLGDPDEPVPHDKPHHRAKK